MPGPYPLRLVATIDANGITAPVFEDIYASLQASYRAIYGSDIDLDPDTQDGQWLAVQAQVIYDFNSALIAGYLSYSPSYAQGAGLSSVVKINGLQRLAPSNSQAVLRLIGQAGATIEQGVAADIFGTRWDLPPLVVIPVEGEIAVTALAETPGAIPAAPDTITGMATLVPGWQSVTNPVAAVPGLPLETDATLRKRQHASTSLAAITPLQSITAAIANIAGVGRLRVYDNDTDVYDVNLIPPHSIAAVVEGGDSQTIAETIALKKNSGCGTYGDIEVVVPDPLGVPNTINFFALIQTPVWVAISIQPRPGYLDTTGNMIVEALAEFVSTLEIGEDVFAAWLYAPADLSGAAAVNSSGMSQAQLNQLSQTYIVRGIWIGTEPNPVHSADVLIDFNAAATANASTISLSLTQYAV
jgi:uncharacterized phage protein gp47/JayE